MILKCSCDSYLGNKAGSQYQEITYGPGMRVHVPTTKENTWRCTICQKEHSKGGSDDKKKSK